MTSSDDNFFVVLEGLDGSGKTQISRQLALILQHTHGKDVLLTFEPHDPSSAGLFIRQVLSRQLKVDPTTLALAYALNRADHNDRIINKFLHKKSQRFILCDRYYLSSLVYQSTDEISMADVMTLNQWARQPDLILFMNVDSRTSYERMRKRAQKKELFEQNLDATRQKYQEAITFLRQRGDTIIEVDANPDFPTVLQTVLDVLQKHGPEWLQIQRPLIPMADEDFTINVEDIETGTQSTIEQFVQYREQIEQTIYNLSVNDLVPLFFSYLKQQGYRYLERAAWTDLNAFHLAYDLPPGIEQRGTALILRENEHHDLITRSIQLMFEKMPDADALQRQSDFMIVLDSKRYTPDGFRPHYERDNDGQRISPSICIIGRNTLAEWVSTQIDEREPQ